MTRCRSNGTESATISVTSIAKGDGPIIEDSQLCGSSQDISRGVNALLDQEEECTNTIVID